jgi:hypothetical protein
MHSRQVEKKCFKIFSSSFYLTFKKKSSKIKKKIIKKEELFGQ